MVSIIIPAFNEVRTITEVIARVMALSLDMEVIVVDDGSTDGTTDSIREEAERDSAIKPLYHSLNRGKGAAVRTALEHVEGSIVIIQDADLEYDPAEYTKLIEPIITGKADVVFGTRFAGGEVHRVLYFWHYLGNRVLTFLSNMFNNLNLTDMETGAKAFKTDILKKLVLEQNRFGFEPEVTAKVARMGCRICEVGISYYGRTYQEGKKVNWKDGIKAVWCIIKYRYQRI